MFKYNKNKKFEKANSTKYYTSTMVPVLLTISRILKLYHNVTKSMYT